MNPDDRSSGTLRDPWCEECESSHDAHRHGEIMAAIAKKAADKAELARRYRVTELARDLFVHLDYDNRGQAKGDADWALACAAEFDAKAQEYLAPKEQPK